jgi:two-component sensor histidine kinase
LCQTAERFVDDVSHEFRTPLTVIQGYCTAMADGLAGPVAPQQMEFLQIVLDRTRDLAQMVDDLLDSSKLRAGSLRVDRKSHDIQQIFDLVRRPLQAKAAANKIRLCESIEPGLPPVFADAEKASRVIVNLVVNAVKFSSEGGEVVLSACRGQDGEIRIEVRDHGRGIAPADLEIIFKRFRQVGMAQRSSTKGFGLGLSIAKELAGLNLGMIGVESAVGTGSTFWFTLPTMDWNAIFSRFFAQSVPDLAAADRLALLRVVSNGDNTLDEARSLVVSTTYARDLVFGGAGGSEVFVTGLIGNAQVWVNRLQESSRCLSRQIGTEGNAGLKLEIVNSWAYPQQGDDAKAALLALTEGALQHA